MHMVDFLTFYQGRQFCSSLFVVFLCLLYMKEFCAKGSCFLPIKKTPFSETGWFMSYLVLFCSCVLQSF